MHSLLGIEMQEAVDEFLCQFRDVLVAILRVRVRVLVLACGKVVDRLHVVVSEERGHSSETVCVCVCVCGWVSVYACVCM